MDLIHGSSRERGSPGHSERRTILHAPSQTELGLANSTVMMRLLTRLVAMDLLTRAEVIMLLEGAAENLLANGVTSSLRIKARRRSYAINGCL